MSISREKRDWLQVHFGCKECPRLTSPINAQRLGLEVGSRLKCDACGSTGIDWPAAYEALGKELELARSAIVAEAADMVKEIAAQVAARRKKNGTAHRTR